MEVSKIIFEDLSKYDFVKKVPFQIKKIAVKDCYKSFINGVKKVKKNGSPFDLSYRTKKNSKQTVFIPKDAVSKFGIYHTISGNLKFSEMDWLNKKFGDCRLIKENGRYFLCVPIEEKRKNISSDKQAEIVALDPGVRTFISYFSTDGRFGVIGYHSFEVLFKKLIKIDHLISQRDREKNDGNDRRCAVLNRKIKRIKWKVNDLVDELHWKTINYLVKNYKLIFLPTYNTSEMVIKGKRKLRNKSVRSMLGFKNYVFGERLKNKCEEYGVNLIRCNEAYTSKTNSFTGEIMNIGSREWFKYDGVKINRDINGARNILLRSMRDDSATG